MSQWGAQWWTATARSRRQRTVILKGTGRAAPPMAPLAHPSIWPTTWKKLSLPHDATLQRRAVLLWATHVQALSSPVEPASALYTQNA